MDGSEQGGAPEVPSFQPSFSMKSTVLQMLEVCPDSCLGTEQGELRPPVRMAAAPGYSTLPRTHPRLSNMLAPPLTQHSGLPSIGRLPAELIRTRGGESRDWPKGGVMSSLVLRGSVTRQECGRRRDSAERADKGAGQSPCPSPSLRPVVRAELLLPAPRCRRRVRWSCQAWASPAPRAPAGGWVSSWRGVPGMALRPSCPLLARTLQIKRS